MQKILKLLEKNVEWIAVGLGAAFLFWMIYGYVFQKPVVASVGGSPTTPGEIDEKIKDGPVARLLTAMSAQNAPPMPVQDFVTDLTHQLTSSTDALALNGPWSGIPLTQTNEVQAPKPQLPNTVEVTELPKQAPAPTNVQFSQGRSNVVVPAAGSLAAAGGGQPQGTPSDRNWVTISATIPMKTMASLFKDKKIPAGFLTTLLRVELVPQEQDPNGNWGPETVIAPLPNVDLQPLPTQNSPIQPQNDYIAWAEKNQISLLQPPFYQVLQADPWYLPGQEPPTPAPIPGAEAANPAQSEQAKIAAEAAAEQQRRDAAAAKWKASHPSKSGGGRPGGPGGSPPGYGGGPPGGPQFVINDPDRPLEIAQVPYKYPPGFSGPPGYNGLPPGYGGPPVYPGIPGYGGPVIPQQSTGAPGAVPAGSFDPQQQADVTIWAHDDTAQPGHTYRYYLRYIIANPVRLSTNVCNPQSLADVFSILSKNSEWSVAISVKSETNFFALNTAPGREEVKFEIFRWKNGAWQSQTVEVDPGDMVGTPRGVGDAMVNFTTGLTLVGVRPDPHNPENRIILLTGDNGRLTRHDLNADRNSDEYKKLKDLVNAKAPPAPGTPQASATP